jgi:acyl carrier protein
LGAEVLVVEADAGVRADMERVAAAARHAFGGVHGVFHAAGIPGGGMIQMLSRESIEAVLAPKVQGTLILDSVFPEAELLVLFSSVNAVVGVAGATDYTSANCFLDAFANADASRSRRVLSIDWDTWQDVGMAAARAASATAANARPVALQHGMSPAQGIDALDRALRASVPQIAVITRDLPALLHAARAASLAQAAPGAAPAGDTPALSQHARPEIDQGFVEPRDDRERRIAEMWCELLGIDRVGIDDNFFELGGHSLIATGLLSRIHREFHVKLPLRTIFDAPTVRGLTQRVADLSWASRDRQSPPDDPDGREEFEI